MNDIIIQSIHMKSSIFMIIMNDIIIQSIHNQLMFYNLNFVKPFYNFSKVKGGKMYHFPSEKKWKIKVGCESCLLFFQNRSNQSINT